MKHFKCIALLSLLSIFSVYLSAHEVEVVAEKEYKYYFGVTGNLGLHSNHPDNELVKGRYDNKLYGGYFSLGTTLFSPFRFDASLMYTQTRHEDMGTGLSGQQATLDALSLILNAFYDISIYDKITAFIGLGFGPVWVDYIDGDTYKTTKNFVESRKSSIAVAIQPQAGLLLPIADNVDLMLGYRFYFLPHYTDFHTHNLDLGLRIKL